MNLRSVSVFLIPLLISFALLASCDKDAVYDDTVSIKDASWPMEDTLVFEALVTDTIRPCKLSITVRNKGSYGYSNLYLFIASSSPAGAVRQDTLQLPLADARGHWYGKGFSDIWETRVLFKPSVRFPHPGVYTFRVRHAMRENVLEGIMDVGLRIEKVQ